MPTSAGATAAIIAAQQTTARRLIVGGFLVEVSELDFLRIAEKTEIVVAGEIGFFSRHRVYFTVVGGITFFCEVGVDRRLPIAAIEARKVDKNGLGL